MFKRFLSAHGPAVPPSSRKPCQPSVEQVLDTCLEDILIHHRSIEESLREYPSCADELRPLLLVAIGLADTPGVSPSPALKRSIRRQLLGIPEKDTKLPRPRTVNLWSRLKKALVVLLLVAAFSLALWGLIAASVNSLPGSPLYSVKRCTESIQVASNVDNADRVRLHSELARRRLNEVKELATDGKAGLAYQTAFDYEQEINSAIESLKPNQPEDNLNMLVLRDQLLEEQAELDSFQSQIPTSSMPAVKHAEMAITKVIGELDRVIPRGD